MIYRLERKVDNRWYLWGEYTGPVRLAKAAHELGMMGFKEIRVLIDEKG